jgi:DNA-directed RNA polymerase specialized sigma24 family protein
MLHHFVFTPGALRRAENICARIPLGASPVMPQNVIRRLSLGDKAAFAEFCDAALDVLFGYIFACIGDRESAKRLVELVCVTAWQRREQICDGMGFNGFVWIMRIAREVLMHERRACFKLHPLVVAGDENADLRPIASLDSLEQELAVLRLCLHVTLDDVAEILGLSRARALVVQYDALMRANIALAA